MEREQSNSWPLMPPPRDMIGETRPPSRADIRASHGREREPEKGEVGRETVKEEATRLRAREGRNKCQSKSGSKKPRIKKPPHAEATKSRREAKLTLTKQVPGGQVGAGKVDGQVRGDKRTGQDGDGQVGVRKLDEQVGKEQHKASTAKSSERQVLPFRQIPRRSTKAKPPLSILNCILVIQRAWRLHLSNCPERNSSSSLDREPPTRWKTFPNLTLPGAILCIQHFWRGRMHSRSGNVRRDTAQVATSSPYVMASSNIPRVVSPRGLGANRGDSTSLPMVLRTPLSPHRRSFPTSPQFTPSPSQASSPRSQTLPSPGSHSSLSPSSLYIKSLRLSPSGQGVSERRVGSSESCLRKDAVNVGELGTRLSESGTVEIGRTAEIGRTVDASRRTVDRRSAGKAKDDSCKNKPTGGKATGSKLVGHSYGHLHCAVMAIQRAFRQHHYARDAKTAEARERAFTEITMSIDPCSLSSSMDLSVHPPSKMPAPGVTRLGLHPTVGRNYLTRDEDEGRAGLSVNETAGMLAGSLNQGQEVSQHMADMAASESVGGGSEGASCDRARFVSDHSDYGEIQVTESGMHVTVGGGKRPRGWKASPFLTTAAPALRGPEPGRGDSDSTCSSVEDADSTPVAVGSAVPASVAAKDRTLLRPGLAVADVKGMSRTQKLPSKPLSGDRWRDISQITPPPRNVDAGRASSMSAEVDAKIPRPARCYSSPGPASPSHSAEAPASKLSLRRRSRRKSYSLCCLVTEAVPWVRFLLMMCFLGILMAVSVIVTVSTAVHGSYASRATQLPTPLLTPLLTQGAQLPTQLSPTGSLIPGCPSGSRSNIQTTAETDSNLFQGRLDCLSTSVRGGNGEYESHSEHHVDSDSFPE
eukprot:Rmarinus@m.20802